MDEKALLEQYRSELEQLQLQEDSLNQKENQFKYGQTSVGLNKNDILIRHQSSKKGKMIFDGENYNTDMYASNQG